MHTFAVESSIRPEEFVRNWTQIARKDGPARRLARERHGFAREIVRYR